MVELIRAIIENRTKGIEEIFKDFLGIFSKECLFLELQNYPIYRWLDINKILVRAGGVSGNTYCGYTKCILSGKK